MAEANLPDSFMTEEIARLETSRKRYILQTRALNDQSRLVHNHVQQASPPPLIDRNALAKKALGECQYTARLVCDCRPYSMSELLIIQNGETISNLTGRLEAHSQHLAKLKTAAPAIVTERLKHHDKVIASLPSTSDLATKSTVSDANRIRLLTEALTALRSNALRDRLDRVFLEAFRDQYDEADSEPSRSESTALEADVKSLYVEIDDVAGMLVRHQYTGPMHTLSQELERADHEARQRALRQNAVQLKSLTNEAEQMKEHGKAITGAEVLGKHFEQHLGDLEKEVRQKTGPASKQLVIGGDNTTVQALQHIGPHEQDSRSGESLAEVLNQLKKANEARSSAVASLASLQYENPDDVERIAALDRRIQELSKPVRKPI